MSNLTQEQREVLLFVHQSQHEESMQHRQSIFNAFSLSMAGLMAIVAGAIAPGYMASNLKWGVGVAVAVVCVFIIHFIRQQRQESEKAMGILRTIEKQLELYENGKYILGTSVLPQGFTKSPTRLLGFTRGDWFAIFALVFLGLSIIAVLFLLPLPQP